MKKLLFFSLILGGVLMSTAQTKKLSHPNGTQERLQEKIFYLFTAIENDAKVMELLKADAPLRAYWDKMTRPSASLPKDGKEIIAPFLWSQSDIKTVGKRLVELSRDNAEFNDLLKSLRASRRYANFETAPDDQYLYKIWEQCAKGLDTVLEVYGAGKTPFYGRIDSVSFDVRSKRYIYAVNTLRSQAQEAAKEGQLFFRPSLEFALNLLYANHRDEAVRYDPLDKKENAKAIAAIGTTDFSAYPYASIVVLGGGPENYRDRLSIAGKINLQLAMKEYRAKKAPFIIVSGGHVHPYMTPYCEALEMKNELIEEYGVPEAHIIIEPYARHTTTNMRNATRLMVDYGIPLEQKSLVVTNPSHSEYTGSGTFTERCREELGYQPVNIHARLSPTTLEFTGNMVSFHQNPNQPLDP
ncbi:YdcF family protein [Flagellimonas okinawensis]|uniref:YdcF family protein n=1 Tax=Flagellimonas okinawensis TaxID=3031324 RepID=A0ABT5XTB3_9FLAO|nr:YdcF family protein [[Muricauda] okinawensis]MDF0709032.1 YdcF family protein [[Muricauda] okinawensis]